MLLNMEALVELPEIKSEIKAEDFAAQQQQQQHSVSVNSQQNCQWVSRIIKSRYIGNCIHIYWGTNLG